MPKPTDRWSLYRWYDREGWLLYVGITDNLPRRASQHRIRSWWAQWGAVVDEDPDVRGVDPTTATNAEMAAIRTEHPVFNLIGAISPRDRVIRYLAIRGIEPEPYRDHLAKLLARASDGEEVAHPARRVVPVAIGEIMEGPTFRRIPEMVDGHRIYDRSVEFIDPTQCNFVAVGLNIPEIGHAIFASVDEGDNLKFEVMGHSAGIYPWPSTLQVRRVYAPFV